MPEPRPARLSSMRITLGRRLALRVADLLRNAKPWHERSTLVGLIQLLAIRIRLRQMNLGDTSILERAESADDRAAARELRARREDGQFNDLDFPRMGSTGTRFGRNQSFWGSGPVDADDVLEPSPREVSRRLLAPLTADTPWLAELRDVYVRTRGGDPADLDQHYLGRRDEPAINLLAAAWIQFMIHDWVSHGSSRPDDPWRLALRDDDDWPQDPMLIRRTLSDPTNPAAGRPPTFLNHETHWWDGSQLYGSSIERTASIRGGAARGKIALVDGLLPLEDEDQNPRTRHVELTGVNGNWWLGLSLLHHLFALEHNHLCDELARRNPGWDGDRLFDQARLVNAALMAKIHTVEWTPAILPHPTMKKAMNGNWSGLFGPRVARLLREMGFRSDLLIGIPGSRVDHHGAAYSLTEEFVSVYRLHNLLPDRVTLRRGEEGVGYAMIDLLGGAARDLVESHDPHDLWFSFGTELPGRIGLHNFPETLRDLHRPTREDQGRRVDLAAVDVLRDRERGVPRYAAFREMLRLPVPNAFIAREDGEVGITDDPVYAHELEGVYGSPDRVDLMVGLYAEPRPATFGFSETALHIFALMASRRLKSDRFFTDDYRPEIYSEWGLRHIESTSMGDIINRHVGGLGDVLRDVRNPFAPWTASHNRRSGRIDR